MSSMSTGEWIGAAIAVAIIGWVIWDLRKDKDF